MEQKTIESIQQRCWDLFMEHKEHGSADVPVIQGGDRQTLTWLSPWGDGDKVVTEEEARKHLDKRVEETLNSSNRVFLYTCKDNAEVCVETIDDDDDISPFDMETIDGTIPENILYIGWD